MPKAASGDYYPFICTRRCRLPVGLTPRIDAGMIATGAAALTVAYRRRGCSGCDVLVG
ncbi:hypothetical protein ACI2LF_06315 [Kribbella sp. NPDC020789]